MKRKTTYFYIGCLFFLLDISSNYIHHPFRKVIIINGTDSGNDDIVFKAFGSIKCPKFSR